jgi:hypothetical protein
MSHSRCRLQRLIVLLEVNVPRVSQILFATSHPGLLRPPLLVGLPHSRSISFDRPFMVQAVVTQASFLGSESTAFTSPMQCLMSISKVLRTFNDFFLRILLGLFQGFHEVFASTPKGPSYNLGWLSVLHCHKDTEPKWLQKKHFKII